MHPDGAEQLTISLFNLGRVSMLQGRHEAAAGWFERALETARELGYREMIAYCLKGIGEVLAARAAGEQAARLLGASDRLFLELGAHVESSEQATYEVTVEQLKDALGDDAYSSAHAEGQGIRSTRRSPSHSAAHPRTLAERPVRREPEVGFEPTAPSLQVRCSTS